MPTVVTPTNPVSTAPGVNNNTYVVEPGATLTVAGGLGPDSVIIDFGGTVLFETPPGAGNDHLDKGIVTVLDGGNLVFGGLQFIGPAAVPPTGGGEKIRLDATSTLGVANTPPGLAGAPGTVFNWVTALDGVTPADPLAGSFNITAAAQHFGLDVGLVGFPPPAPLSKPAWSFSQPVSVVGIFSPTATVPMGVPMTPNT